MSQVRRAALSLVVFLVAGFVVAAPAGAASSLTVTPSTDLHGGQTVTVAGSGFEPEISLASAQCKAGAITIADCDTGHAVFPSTDATGAFSFLFIVRAAITTTNGTVDCTANAGACVMAAANLSDIAGTAASAPLSFAPPAPPQRGAIVGPSAPTGPGEDALISATGFAPYAVLEGAVCAADAVVAEDCDAPEAFDADDSGAADLFLYAGETLLTLNGDTIDCTVDGACAYAVWDARDFGATVATAPVRIAPPVAGTLTVEPATGLHDGQVVTLSGTDWPASTFMQVRECDGTGLHATCIGYDYTESDNAGNFSTSYTVFGSPEFGLDCEGTLCWIQAAWSSSGTTVSISAPITFDNTPIPVTSHYTGSELAAVDGAANTLGIASSELQHVGPWALAWVLGITHTGAITPVADTGADSLTTVWPPSQFSFMGAAAAGHGATLAEFQKTGALFVAYILALSGA